MNKTGLLNNYKTGRWMIVFVVALALINIGFIIGGGVSIIMNPIIPQLSLTIVFKDQYSLAIKIIVFLIGIIAPIGLYIISFFRSKTNYKWLMVDTIICGLDTGVLISYLVVTGINSLNLFDAISELFILSAFLKAYKAGKELDNDFSEVTIEQIHKKDKNFKPFYYSTKLAKENKCTMVLPLLANFAVFIVITIALIYFVMNFGEHLGQTVSSIIFTVALLGSFAIFILILLRLYPYVNAGQYVYYRDKDDICRTDTVNSGITERFPKLKVIDRNEKRFKCKYLVGEKEKTLIIPNAYPNIELILKNKD